MKPGTALAIVVGLAVLAASCSADDTSTASATVDHSAEAGSTFDPASLRDPDVPDLPFADNPDPNQCGIPVPWGPGGQAWLSGVWQGELIQPEVLLYDSHQRLGLTGSGDHGAQVEIILYQSNPVLDYYFVEVVGTGDKGWIPGHFLSFEPVV